MHKDWKNHVLQCQIGYVQKLLWDHILASPSVLKEFHMMISYRFGGGLYDASLRIISYISQAQVVGKEGSCPSLPGRIVNSPHKSFSFGFVLKVSGERMKLNDYFVTRDKLLQELKTFVIFQVKREIVQ